ncbi:MAG: AMP-dependent synthetase and ligase [Candidatus Entotheonella factor]|uniref:AMP-dependent synthetase and ligase n=1 Tax=Entotheonella factor TaxID=1429438 RepID=W4LWP0_ENTF1|nr:MAG: AMP-dependent synthetase and ligase [Candidatus Entotheonella factor]
MKHVPHTAQILSHPQTLVDLLSQRGLQQPDRLAFRYLTEGATTEVSLTYAELDEQARAIGAMLGSLGAQGERILLLYPPGLAYIAAFFGCLYAGATAIPGYPPRFHRSLERLQSMAENAQASIALTTSSFLVKTKQWFTWTPGLSGLRWLATDQLDLSWAATWVPPEITLETLALLQYTSGSTHLPKGVMLSHQNLLHNAEQTERVLEHTEHNLGVGWLPLHHDMGLIGSVLQPLYAGFPCVLMSPMSFLQRPIRWLEAISKYRATTSGGPNFAYDLCVRKITPDQRANLDLSCWEIAINGAEPVRHTTIEQFAAAFEPYGFRREAFYPCYGLAESTLMSTGGKKTASPVIRNIQKVALEQHQIAIPCIGATGAQALVGCGKSLKDQSILIVDPDNLTPCAPNQIGEIWISGPSVAQGYWNHPKATEETFGAYTTTGEGPYLRTGDLGFLSHGELFITSRLKDVIIIRARTHHPQDIEATVEQSHPVLRPHCVAAFAVEIEGEERLVVVQEVERRMYQTPEDNERSKAKRTRHPPRHLEIEMVIGNICQAVAEKHDVQVSAVLLLRPGSIPKTSSGKIRRHACRIGFLNHTLDVVGQWYASHLKTVSQAHTTPMGDQHAQRELTSLQTAIQQPDGHVA